MSFFLGTEFERQFSTPCRVCRIQDGPLLSGLIAVHSNVHAIIGTRRLVLLQMGSLRLKRHNGTMFFNDFFSLCLLGHITSGNAVQTREVRAASEVCEVELLTCVAYASILETSHDAHGPVVAV